MRGVRRATMLALATVVLATAGVVPVVAQPNADGQPPQAPSRDVVARQGWMTTAATDRVFDIAQIGDTVYVAGTFLGVQPTTAGVGVAQGFLAAFDAATGELRTGFRPTVNGTVFTLEPSPDGTVLYAGGSFTSVSGVTTRRLAALSPVTGTVVRSMPAVSGGSVRSLVTIGSTLYLGGSFSLVAGQPRNRLAAVTTAGALVAGWRPSADDGVVLTLERTSDGSRLYVGGRFTGIDGTPEGRHLAALDPTTGARLTGFAPAPAWEVYDILADDRGWVWIGHGGALGRLDIRRDDGTLITRHETSGDIQAVEQVGGLVYVGGHDMGIGEDQNLGIVDPAAPAILDTTSFDEPSWGGDGLWAIHSTGTDLWLGGNPSGPYTGFTRHAAALDPPPRIELSPVLAEWRRLDTAAAPAGWTVPGFDDSAWPSGPAEIGFGDGGEATLVPPGRVTYYVRRTFTVTDPATLTDLRLELLADDGAIVYVNGTEVARTNLPAGVIGDHTLATTARFGNLEDSFKTFVVPASVLVDGTNTIAVEVHQNGASSSDLSFDARLSAVRDTVAPTSPGTPVVGALTRTSAELSWTPSTDSVGVSAYEVLVDGAVVATSPVSSVRLEGLAPATGHEVTVRARDAVGNRSASSPVVTVRTPYGPVALVDLGSVWRFLDGGTPAPGWEQPGFDDTGWAQGPAVLGRAKGDEATVLTPGTGTAWFRRSFTVTGVSGVGDLLVDLVADDGAVVYVNGVEVVRDNLSLGPLSPSTTTSTYRTGTAERRVRSFVVPATALVEGVNSIAVAVHQGAGSTDARFDLALTAR